MIHPPSGPNLTADQCRSLDEDYFAGDPSGYFRSKVIWLIRALEGREESLGSLFNTISAPLAEALPGPVCADEKFAAVEALRVRFEVAEAVLRLVYARRVLRISRSPLSLWAALAGTPNQLANVISEIRDLWEDPQSLPEVAGLFVSAPRGSEVTGPALASAWTGLNWIVRAVNIVTPAELDFSGGVNKLKHGAAAVAQDSLRITMAPGGFTDTGEVPLSMVSGPEVVNVVDSVVLDFVSQPPKMHGRGRPGIERTFLRAEIESLLMESWILAHVHGVLVATAAYLHNDNACFPGLRYGALPPKLLPEAVLLERVVGMRFPLTTGADGNVLRPAGILLSDGSFLAFGVGQGRQGRVVPDETPSAARVDDLSGR